MTPSRNPPGGLWKTTLVLIPCFAPCPAGTETSLSCQLRSRAEVEEEALEVRLQQAEARVVDDVQQPEQRKGKKKKEKLNAAES